MGDGGLLDREEIPGPRIAVVIKNRHPELEIVERGGRPAQQRVEDLRKLRQQMPHTFFLVPGYGAQGGTAADVANAFHAGGKGAVINSSRGIMCAWKKNGQNGLDYQEAARQAALDMREDICA